MKYAIPRLAQEVKGQPFLRPESVPLLTNGFTIGKSYPILRQEANVYIVVNDRGHERIIFTDGSLCAHIVTRYGNHPAGFFEIQEGPCDTE